MKKTFISLSILTATFILCSNAGFCKTVNNYYYNPQPKVGQSYSIVQHKPSTPGNIVGHNVKYKDPKFDHKHNKKLAKKYHNKYKYSNNNYRYNNNNRIGNSYYYQPTLWERIFNL